MSQCTIERTIWQFPRTACIERIFRPRMVRKLSLVQGNISIFIEELNPELKSQDTKMRKAVEVE
ncbi:hypothetical protein pdam_00003744 [Pocillopora damicornis]|uniref:Uncharacterized protein n=1 Tax=Pocillopora damicornis TaxID=46731 RepID=A0A3M6UEH3_POCDA|nr:hypothetical protein pdam_00003744 [Pocillopora damicornis]